MEKLNGAIFSLWKSLMEDILILRDPYFPIEGIEKQPSSMMNDDCRKTYRKVIAIIRQFLATVYFNVVKEKTTEGLWKKLHDLYEKNMASNKVFLMKKVYNLNMKEGASIMEHLNEFNIITSYLAYVKLVLDDEIRAIFLMCSMPDNWENMIVAMSTSAPARTLKFDDVSNNLMNEEL
jgi:hypothetical protein